jgi:tetratricopeptide (TPR) repeat protein
MKRTAVILAIASLGIGIGIMSVSIWAGAQTSGQPAQQTPPAAGQAAPAGGATMPATKRPPQLKTKPEQDAYNAAAASPDAATMEKAADDFATKFPDSEVRELLYKNTMRLYLNTNNAEKTEAMGRKVLSYDADDPEALVQVAFVIAERTRDSDIDRDQRFGEATSMATKALQTIDTDITVPAGTPQDKVDAYKGELRSQAYSIMGAIEFKKENYAAAKEDLQKSIDAYPSDPAPVDVLRLALAIDKQATATVDQDKQQKLYAEALKVANRAVELTQEHTTAGDTARHERDRLHQLTAGTAPAPASTPAAAPQPQAPPKN